MMGEAKRRGMTQVARLALREEGELWNAYFAQQGTMDGALFLGSIAMGAVQASAKTKQTFMDLMRDVVNDLLKEKTGHQPTWGDPEPAPEHERSGSA